MKLLFDENLSPQLPRLLANEYPGSEHLRNVGLLRGAEDRKIWHYASQNGFVIVSKDVDFEQGALLYGHPPKVVRTRLGNRSTTRVKDLLIARQNDLIQFVTNQLLSVLLIS